MIESRRQAVQKEDELLLRRIAGFEQASLLELLSDGPVNASYLCNRGNQRYVFRRDKAEASSLGLDREREARIVRLLSESGLAQAFCYEDRSRGVTLRRWRPGLALTARDLVEPGALHQVAGLLRRVHAISCTERPMDFDSALNRYKDGAPGLGSVYSEARAILTELGRFGEFRALCHNDPVAGNFLTDKGALSLIDWEYAAPGDPFFDLAVVCEHHSLEADQRKGFLQAYLQREARWEELERFSLQCGFYACLLKLWQAATKDERSDFLT